MNNLRSMNGLASIQCSAQSLPTFGISYEGRPLRVFPLYSSILSSLSFPIRDRRPPYLLSYSFIGSNISSPLSIRAIGLQPSTLGSESNEISTSPALPFPPVITFHNDADKSSTLVSINVQNRSGILQLTATVFRELGLNVQKASVDFDAGAVLQTYFVTDSEGKKVLDPENLQNIEKALINALNKIVLGKQSSRSYRRQNQSLFPPSEQKGRTDLLFRLMNQYLNNDIFSIQKSIVNHVEYTVARSRFKFDDFEAYQATSYSVRDRLIESWNDTQMFFKTKDPKRIYFLSMEFLMGRSLLNSIYNLGIKDTYAEALRQLGFDLEVLVEQERDAALGNGGLGRLAACFLDSLATLDYPAWGYGLRYEYGLFKQVIKDGFQHEQPDFWLNFGNPWEIERVHVTYPVKFYGKVEEMMQDGSKHFKWIPDEMVEAVAYDNPIPGFDTNNTITLRLWAAKPSGEFNIQSYNTGDYVNAILNKQHAETISSVLYPDDRTYQGKELRLKQQHFFVSASLQDIIRRFKDHNADLQGFENKVALQLNDTHPTIGVVELMRMLIDDERLDWKTSWEITTKVFTFAIHSMVPEVLEKWPVELLGKVLPRHLQIIYKINFLFIEDLKKKIGNDYDRLARMSIIEEGEKKSVRMTTLALVACHTINGVSHLHTELMKSRIFKDFYELWPDKFQNKTNGVTQRRWLAFSNPGLGEVITKWLGTNAWMKNLDLLSELRKYADDPHLQEEWLQVRRQNKSRLAKYIEMISGVKVSIDALFDVHVKRIHEYKRQFLNVLSIIHRYDCIKNLSLEERKKVVPRVCIIGGKAAPGYEIAKKIIKLVHAVGEKLNNDPDVGHLLKLVFVPDYNVSVAELVIPASDLSQHISTAGNEASGTGSMKFAMNGCLILGTMDGANIEIQEEIGHNNMFTFGTRADEVPKLRAECKEFQPPREFRRVVGMIRNGVFGHQEYFQPLCDTVDGGQGEDFYLLGNDFLSYLEAQAAVDRAYVYRNQWAKMSILSTAGSGKFSSDRTIKEYAEQSWGIQPCKRPL